MWCETPTDAHKDRRLTILRVRIGAFARLDATQGLVILLTYMYWLVLMDLRRDEIILVRNKYP